MHWCTIHNLRLKFTISQIKSTETNRLASSTKKKKNGVSEGGGRRGRSLPFVASRFISRKLPNIARSRCTKLACSSALAYITAMGVHVNASEVPGLKSPMPHPKTQYPCTYASINVDNPPPLALVKTRNNSSSTDGIPTILRGSHNRWKKYNGFTKRTTPVFQHASVRDHRTSLVQPPGWCWR